MLKRLKNWLIFWTVWTVVALLRRLPAPAQRLVGRGAGRLAWWLGDTERSRALDNLERAGVGRDVRSRSTLARRVLRNLGLGAAECLALPGALRRDPDVVQFDPDGLLVLQQALAEGKGVVYVTAHLGNWELMAAAVARHADVSVLFKPSYDPRFTEMIERFRASLGVTGFDVSRRRHLRQSLQALREGGVLGILIDQPVDSGIDLPFFGNPAPTTTLPGRLAARTGAAVIAGFARRTSDGFHRVAIESLAPAGADLDPVELMREATAAVERAVRRDPEQWAWTLDRWRLARRK